jgi:integrative and conjugative element protein (TIGR02256 family)
MEIRVPSHIRSELIEVLQKAGGRETGGILMGECLTPNRFRITEISVSSKGGFAYFSRKLVHALDPLRRFFERTGHQYQRFNYLGEWHSHPSFVPEPSTHDLQSMLQIVQDPGVGANFVILLIVRLRDAATIEDTATVFVPGGTMFRAELLWERADETHR